MDGSGKEARNELIQAIFDATPDMITVSSLSSGTFIEVNSAFEEQSGYTRAETIGKSVDGMGIWVDPAERGRFLSLLERDRSVRNFESLLRMKSGAPRRYQLSATRFELNGEPAIVTVIRDITEATGAVEMVRKSAFLLERAEEMAKIGSWEFDYATKAVTGSEGAARIYGVPRENLTVSTIEQVPLPEFRPLLNKARDEHIMQGKPYDIEFKIRRQDDGRILDVHSRALWDGKNKRLFGILRDITDEKKAEAGLREAIAAREALIRELYHRINNTLQTVVSLLLLEQGREADPAAEAMVRRITRRVSAMAHVHESLYESRNLSRIDLREYLPRLVDDIRERWNPASAFDFRFDLDDVSLNIDAAVPCGILLEELLENAMSHAYEAGAEGVIRIAARRSADGSIELVVEDQGPGLSIDPADPPPACLGLRLARTLAEGQLRGTLAFRNAPGCACSIRFRDDHLVERV